MDPDDDPPFLPVAEERLSLSTRRIVTGRVRLRVDTVTEDTPLSAELQGERVEITRIPIDREVTEAPAIRTEGDVTILPVVEEVLIVERRLMLREEVHLRRIATRETVETTVPLRRQNVVIDWETPTPKETDND